MKIMQQGDCRCPTTGTPLERLEACRCEWRTAVHDALGFEYAYGPTTRLFEAPLIARRIQRLLTRGRTRAIADSKDLGKTQADLARETGLSEVRIGQIAKNGS
jgi:hypothetical protein